MPRAEDGGQFTRSICQLVHAKLNATEAAQKRLERPRNGLKRRVSRLHIGRKGCQGPCQGCLSL